MLGEASASAKFGEVVQAKRAKSADDLGEIVKATGGLCKALDDYWPIDLALLRMLCGSSAEQRASGKILSQLPSAEREVDMKQSLQQLEVMAASAGMRLSPVGLQASLRFIVKNLAALAQGITLSQKLDSCSALVKKALGRFAFFLAVPNPDKEGDKLMGR